MKPILRELLVFEKRPWMESVRIFVEIKKEKDLLQTSFVMKDFPENLDIPKAKSKPSFRDELWKETCFEAFLQSASSPSYLEWNFSPSGDWWCCQFEDIRKSPKPLGHRAPKKLEILRNDRSREFKLNAEIEIQISEPVRIGLACILKNKQDELGYWSLSHRFSAPNFHDPESFQILI